MLTDQDLHQQLQHVLTETEFSFIGERYVGKVRDNYIRGSERFLITSDRLSCFDVVVTSIPFKGEVLNFLAQHWFNLSKDIVPNHIIDIPDPNLMVVKNCEILPVEVVVRAYLAGSAWRDYQAGKSISGVTLPAGMRSAQKLERATITPSIKAPKGEHDLPISEAEILSRGLVSKKIWDEVREKALALFDLGSRSAAERGLILVDTKYEFGILAGKLILADEIHTLDSSRYWVAESYAKAFESGESPQMLDKEPTRQWLLSQGYQGEGAIPAFSNQHRVQIARHYLDSAHWISGAEVPAKVGPALSRVEVAIKSYLAR